MFMQLLQTQVSVPASQTSRIKSERTPDPEVFPGEGSFIKQIHERLETFGIDLNLKMTLNLDHMLTTKVCIAYSFSRISKRA